MNKKQICAQIEQALKKLYPGSIVQGTEVELSEVEFFMEQCLVTTKLDGESSQQRVIAITTAEWAKFTKNFNCKVSSVWFGWHEMMMQARARLAHLSEQNLENKAKKLVKDNLIQRYGKEAYDAAKDRSAFLVEHANWDKIDALAKSICNQLQIQPDQLTIVMVAGSQNHSPSPQVQGLCRHGHELRFCIVDDFEKTMSTRYFYDRESEKPAPYEILGHHPNAPKPNLRDMLRELRKRIIVSTNASPVSIQNLTILKPVKTKNNFMLQGCAPKILTWNLQLGTGGNVWDLTSVGKLLEQHDICLFQEIPNAYLGEVMAYLGNDFWFIEQTLHGNDFKMLTAIRKQEAEKDNPWSREEVEYEGQIRALIAKQKIHDKTWYFINVHLPADTPAGESRDDQRRYVMSLINNCVNNNDQVWLAGDFNCADYQVGVNNPYRTQIGGFLKEITKVELKILENCFSATYHWARVYIEDGFSHSWKEVDFICTNTQNFQLSCTMFHPPTHAPGNQNSKHYPVTNIFSSLDKNCGIQYTCNGEEFNVAKLAFRCNTVSGDISPKLIPHAYLHGENDGLGFKITQRHEGGQSNILFLRKTGKVYNAVQGEVGSWNWIY